MTSSSSSTPVALVTGGARGIDMAIGQWFLGFDAIELPALAGRDHGEKQSGCPFIFWCK